MSETSIIKEIPIDDVVPDPNQPRRSFDDAKLKELSQSIQQFGLLQPILVRPIEDGKFEIVHGERRWRACKLAEKTAIKAEVRDIGNKEKLEIQLVENLQREDLNPIEEAETLKRLVDEFSYTHEELGNRIGKSREYVTNKLRLLGLPSDVKQKLSEGSISEGHAKTVISLGPNEQEQVIKKVVEQGLRVRETEELVRQLKQGDDVPRGTSNKQILKEISNGLVEVKNLVVWKTISQGSEIKKSVPADELIDAYVQDLKRLRRIV